MSRESWKLSLKDAAELAGVSEDDVLHEAKAGRLQVCIKIPECVVVFSDFCGNEESESHIFKRYSEVPRLGHLPEKIDNVSFLVMNLMDSQKLCTEGSTSVSKFSFAYVLQDGNDGVVLKKISPPNLLYSLKMFPIDSTTSLPSKYSYGKSISKFITIDDIFLVRGDVEKFKFDNIPDNVRYGNFRVQSYTSKRLAALNEASTHFFSQGHNENVSSKDIESWLEKTGLFTKTSAHLVAHLVKPHHNSNKGRKYISDESYKLSLTKDTPHYKFNTYTSDALALINEAAYVFFYEKLTETLKARWLKSRNFSENNIKEILKITKIDESY